MPAAEGGPSGLLIYAIVDLAAGEPDLAGHPAGGIDAAPLSLVSYRDLAAVVSAIDVAAFAPDLAGGLPTERQEEDRRTQLRAFQQVNLALLERTGNGGMLPLTFGLTADDEDGVARVLANAYLQLRTYLDRLRGTVELVIQASWELPKVLQAIVRDDPAVAGTDPIQAGRRLFEAAELKKRKLVTAIHGKLSPLSRDCSDAPLRAETMILNRSYLVEKAREPLFDEAVDAVGTELEEFLTFRYLGPLPVYSFVAVELNQGNFPLVDRSRRILQLPETASWQDLKTAYRELVLRNHPDRNPDDLQAARRTRDVVEAYEVLRAYCRSLPDSGEARELRQFSFARETVEQALTVDERGARAKKASPAA